MYSSPDHRDRADQSPEEDGPPREHRQHRPVEQPDERRDQAVHADGDGEAVEMKRIQLRRSQFQ